MGTSEDETPGFGLRLRGRGKPQARTESGLGLHSGRRPAQCPAMPKRCHLLSILLFAVFGGFAIQGSAAANPLADGRNLGLEELFDRIEDLNLDLLIGREGVTQAETAADRERSFLLPRVDLNASQFRSRQPLTRAGGDAFDEPAAGVRPINRFEGKIVGSISLIDPVNIATYRAARRGVRVAERDYEQAVQEILAAVGRIYFTHLRNVSRFDVIESNIERAEVLLQLARNQLDAGVATQIDVTRAEAQLAIEEQARLQQETVVVDSSLTLKRLLDLDVGVELDLRPARVRRTDVDLERMPDLGGILEARAEYQREREQRERNLIERRAAAWERFPSLNLIGEYGYVSERAFDGDERNAWLVGVTASVPIFEGFRIRSNQRLAESRLRTTELRLRDLEQQIASELTFARQDVRSRLAQIEVAEKNRSLADEELRLARIRFEQGVADNREVIEAQNNLARAEDNLVEAVFLYRLGRLQLARVHGDVRRLLGELEN
ncbi:MAG: TolC family protein [Puniceicoccaceae bacterium]|nr:MAG: TolC family protein [Puniceicoccaceae bacterium]